MPQTIRPDRQEAVANGATDVAICDTPPASTTRTVIGIRYTNTNVGVVTPILKTKVGAAAAIERERVVDVAAGATESGWCSRDRPYHLEPGDTLQGALTGAGAGEWRVEFLEMTDA